MQKQHTLAGPASLAGVSLHTGEKVTLTIHPAPVDHGFKFRRTDLKDQPTVDALACNVRTVERATTLVEGNVKVHTVEHILSALTGLGVDNALIEMDANEPPIGDGSASPYVALIKKAGIVEQDAPRRYCEIREPVAVQTKNGSILVILPDTKFRVSCTQAGPDGNHTQYLSLEITPEVYEKEIAPARTFVHYEDVEPLMEKGLIRGGSLENAIVIRGESVLSKEPLRFPDEFVRHKILDIVGDLTLVGRPILGHVVAVRPGHGPNTELAAAIAKEHAKMMAMIPPAKLPVGERVLPTTEIMKILPHRYPFLMVDRIVAFEGDTKCTGVKSVTINEPFFQGHFPGHPVMPGVLQVEAMAQVASILMMLNTQNSGKIGYFMSADEVKFRKPVFPGDTLFIHCELTRSRKTMARAACSCTVNGEVVSEGNLLFGLVSE
jgi:UDP-3-O-[3-hydroxymyristoyl] N-acetylglucosamine deacetylase/3-hydroxyacyl-[acyl-carrier-protein] dehydratase